MLLRRDAKFLDTVTNRYERVFPAGTDWMTFRSQLPAPEVFANSVLDPAIGIGGELGLAAFATADWRNWTSSLKIGLFELSTRVGLPPLKDQSLNQGLSLVFNTLDTTAYAFANSDNPAEIVPELVTNVGFQVVMQVLQMVGASNPVTFVVTAVIQIATWAVSIATTTIESDLGKHLSFPPMQSEDPATDTWQVTRVFEVFRSRGVGGVAFPDGELEPASNANYTSLYLPAYRTHMRWQIQYRDQGVAAQHGYGNDAHAGRSGGGKFDAGDASSFGFMPGTTTMLRVLQASYRLYASTRGTPIDRYSLRCRGVDQPCWKSVKTFDGSRDCRQCVDAEWVWPVKGLGWAYGGAPLNATTPGENTGMFFPTANKLLGNLLDMITQPGPLLYTVDTDAIREQWKRSFESFWEFARAEWRRYNGSGWRGLISRLATLMTAFKHDDRTILGGRELHMPLTHIANPREADFAVPFKYSIFSQIIEPFCEALGGMQRHYLDTVSVAYIPPGAGALYNDKGNIRKSSLGDAFLDARRNLLAANKRVLIDLREVSDPEFRAELERAGVKPSPVDSRLFGSPGVSGHELLKPDIKPRRAPLPPRVARASPFEGAVKLLEVAPQPSSRARARTSGRQVPAVVTAKSDKSNRTAALVVGGVTLVALTAATVALAQTDDEKKG